MFTLNYRRKNAIHYKNAKSVPVRKINMTIMGARRNFRRGERAPKRPPSRRKRPPPKKKKLC